MRKILYVFVLLVVGILFSMSLQDIQAQEIPTWVRNNAGWWSDGLISEQDFVFAIEYLINQEIIKVPPTAVSDIKTNQVPAWIKNSAGWWANEQISDDDFLNGIQHLVKVGIISVQTSQEQVINVVDTMCQCVEGCPCTIGGIDLSRAGPREGSSDAPITLVMFSDHQCKNCARWLEHVKPVLVENYLETGKAKFYYLDFPFLGDDSSVAAQATYCAADQGKYLEFHKILYEKQSGVQSGWCNVEAVKDYAVNLGLDSEEFSKCLVSEKHSLRVSHNKWVGSLHGIEGTPVFFIIGSDGVIQRIDGSQPSIVFDNIIKEMN